MLLIVSGIWMTNFNQGIDGVDHINIYSKGKTVLGRWLTNFAHTPIVIPEHGSFASVEAYWYWLISGNDDLRPLYGYKAKELGKKSQKKEEITPQFQEKICRAIDIKLKSNLEMLQLLADSTLPLVHYYEYSGKRVDAGYYWITNHISNRRDLLKKSKWKKV